MNTNWKFWRWGTDSKRRAEEREVELMGVNERLMRDMEGLKAENRSLDIRLADLYQRTPAMVMKAQQERHDLQRLLVLGGLAESNPLWQAVLSYADEHERTEREVALKPDLSDGQRQYNAGRAASAYDFATALRDLFWKAQHEAKKRG